MFFTSKKVKLETPHESKCCKPQFDNLDLEKIES